MKLTTIKSILAAALCAVGLSSFAAEPEAVQLWEGGPYWATVNVGIAEKGAPAEYGALYRFNDDEAKNAAESFGEGWRLPTKEEFENLISKCDYKWTEQNGVNGRLFTGNMEGYKDKSIFLPAAADNGGDGRRDDIGCYWSSSKPANDPKGNAAMCLNFGESNAYVTGNERTVRMSVRVVRDTPPVSEPTVTVGEVTAGEPWSTITVNYTLGGTDSTLNYKVAFDITAGGQTASVTNDAAKLTDGAATKEIDTAALFGREIVDTKAKVKVSLIAVKPKAAGVQLWANGPFWAESNIGTAEPEVPAAYGALYMFDNDEAKNAAESLGAGWRLPTKQEFEDLISKCDYKWTEQNGVQGFLFTGNTDGYKDKSIFLPAAGRNGGKGRDSAGFAGDYWSSDVSVGAAWNITFYEGYAAVSECTSSCRMSVRAVR